MADMLGPVSTWEDRGVERSGTLPSDWYTSPELYDLERRTLFREVWHCVGRTDQVAEPGQYFTCEVADEQVVVSRGRDGELRAMSNVCLHRGGPVAVGCGQRKAFQCPYHGWMFELDGRVRRTQGMDGTVRLRALRDAAAAVPGRRLGADRLGCARARRCRSRRGSATSHRGSRTTAPTRCASPAAAAGRSAATGSSTSTTTWRATTSPSFTPASPRASARRSTPTGSGEYSNEQYGAEPHPRGPGSRVAGILGGTQELRALKPPLEGLDESEAHGLLLPLGLPADDDQLHAGRDPDLHASGRSAPERTESTLHVVVPGGAVASRTGCCRPRSSTSATSSTRRTTRSASRRSGACARRSTARAATPRSRRCACTTSTSC